MITKFGTLFAGHVDLPEVGYDAPPVNSYWLPNGQLATVYAKTEAIAKFMDRSGYETLWLAEHHFQREGYECISNILMLAVHLCHLTEKLKIGSAFNIPPMWHPLRLAEDYATADFLTGGRVIFGIGRGYHTREVEVFGAPLLDKDANRDLFEEQIEVIFKAFNESSFSHHGKYYDIPPKVPYRGYELEEITLVPRPLNLPVECWQPIVSASERGLNLMAKYSIKGVIGGGAAPGGAADKVVDAWQRVQANHGRELPRGGDLNVGFSCYIADTEEQAIEEATKYFEENVKMFAPLGFVGGLTDEQIAATADPLRVKSAGLPTLKDAIKAGSWLCGPPDLIIEKLMDVQKRLPGLEQITLNNTIGMPQDAILEQLDRFASNVMPAFKDQ